MSDTQSASLPAPAVETVPAGLHRLQEPATGASIEITEPYFFLPRYMCGDLSRTDDRIEWRPNRIGRLWKLSPHSYPVADVSIALIMSVSVIERKLAYLAVYVGENEYWYLLKERIRDLGFWFPGMEVSDLPPTPPSEVLKLRRPET